MYNSIDDTYEVLTVRAAMRNSQEEGRGLQVRSQLYRANIPALQWNFLFFLFFHLEKAGFGFNEATMNSSIYKHLVQVQK